MAAWERRHGLGHLCFMIGAQSIVARQSVPAEQDRNFGHLSIGVSLGQLFGPIVAGALIVGPTWRVRAPPPCSRRQPAPRRASPRCGAPSDARTRKADHLPMQRILRARGVAEGIFISLAVLSATDILTAYLPVLGEDLVMTPLLRVLGRRALLAATCLMAAVVCAAFVLAVPLWAMAVLLALLASAWVRASHCR
ncbi:MFS transporter [Streptomyces mirabilis]|uniref:MFS transporter n=1 Tax=Streptomyces mirabilis TaxID=68239 RepID=UPI0037F8F5B5